MKHILKLILCVGVTYCGLSQADSFSEYSSVVSVGGNGVTIRDTQSNWFYGGNYLVEEDNFDISGSETAHHLSLVFGRRVYLNSNETRGFVDTSLNISSKFPDASYEYYRLSAVYGFERFISEEVSLEASVGIGLSHFDGRSYRSTSFSAPVSRLSFSYYYN